MKIILRNLRLVFIIFVSLRFSGINLVIAQGTAFTYQGRLTDQGTPANGTFDLTFTLLNAPSGGAMVGESNLVSNTAVINGIFNVTLDFGENFPGADRWLEIGVRTNGTATFTTLSPPQKVTPTPYAMTAANLSGPLPVSQLPLNVARLDANETFTGQINFTGGNVGIGTTTPFFGNKLQVEDPVHATIASRGPEAGFALSDLSGINTWLWQIRPDVGGTNNDLKLLRFTDAGYRGIDMQIQQSSGNVGIGTGNPQARLDVAGAVAINGTTIINEFGQWVGSPVGLKGDTGATGPAGPPGPQGIQGIPGATGSRGPAGGDGNTVLNGPSAPSASIGTTGDFYINTVSHTIYGPKGAGAWGSAASLVGPTGPQGPPGIPGISIWATCGQSPCSVACSGHVQSQQIATSTVDLAGGCAAPATADSSCRLTLDAGFIRTGYCCVCEQL